MTTLLAGLGPAGRGVLTAMHVAGVLPEVCADGLVVLDPEETPGGGALGHYDVRSDSAAIVFAECLSTLLDEPELAGSAALASVLALPDGESIALSVVGRLLSEGTAPLLRRVRALGGTVRLGARVSSVRPLPSGGAVVVVSGPAGSERFVVSRLVLAVGGEPWFPPELVSACGPPIRHSDELLRPAGLARALDSLPPNPRVVVVGRAHSAFSVADRLLASERAEGWGAGAVRVATRGGVRVTYPDAAAAHADGASFSAADVCLQSGRVWRLCGLRGDSARRYRLGRDGVDPRLHVQDVADRPLDEVVAGADLVVAATGYRSKAPRLVGRDLTTRPDGALVDLHGHALEGIRAIGLGSGSRRGPLAGGEPSYTGPVDGVWHYQTVLAPPMLTDLFGARSPGRVLAG